MQNLTIKECTKIAGGQQSFVITEKTEFMGVSDECLKDFFEQNKLNLAIFSNDSSEFYSALIEKCKPVNVNHHTFGQETSIISLQVI